MNTDTPGTITATILPDDAIPAKYTYGSQRSAQVTVNNIEFTNLVSLDDAIENSGVTRGHNFTITAKINQTQSMYTSIPYTIENVGNKAPSLPSSSGFIIIQAGSLTGSRSITVNQFHPTNIADDAAYRVSIQTNPSSVYTLNTQASEITIPVHENSEPTAARPVVSIALTNPEDFVAGNPVSFTVTATPAPTNDLTVQIIATSSGNMLTDSQQIRQTAMLTNSQPTDTVIIGGQLTGILGTLTTKVEQGNGFILPIIETNLNFRMINDEVRNLKSEITIVIDEDSVPTFDLRALTDTIVRGKNARFQISSSTTFNSPRFVYVTISGSPTNLISRKYAKKVTINANENTAEFSVTTLTDPNIGFNSPGTLTASVPGPNNTEVSARVRTIDDDIPTGISIIPDTSTIFEGETAKFIVVASGTESSDRELTITVTDGSSNIIDTNSANYPYNQVTIAQNSQFTRLNVDTVKLFTAFSNVSITATIVPDSENPPTYTVGTLNSAQVTVDNLVYTNLVSLDNAIETAGVTRGHNFIITAKINQTQSMSTSIPYTIENVGNKAPSLLSNSGFINIPAGTLSGSRSISVNQSHSTNIAADAAYKVSIQTNPSSVYTLNTQASEITIPVHDNSNPTAARPIVSIAPTTLGDVVAGNPVSFTVTATPAPTSDLSVKVRVTTAGNFIVPNLSSNQPVVTLTNANPSNMFEFTGSLTGITGTITARVVQGDGYLLPIIESNLDNRTIASEVRNLKGETTVIVEEEHMISVLNPSITSNPDQPFYISFSAQPRFTLNTDIKVRVTEEAGTFLLPSARNQESFVFPAYNRRTYIEFGTMRIANDNDTIGRVKVEILDGTGYQIGATAIANITIDESSVPTYSISALTSTIIRGNDARFRISSDVTINNPRYVYVTISGNPTNLISRRYTLEVIINANENTAEFSVPTLTDTNTGFNSPGTLTASIPGPNNTEVSARVRTIDDNIPTGISIIPDSSTIIEGETAKFIVVASGTESTDRVLTITVADGSSDIIDTNSANYPYNQVTIAKNTQFTRLNVDTVELSTAFSNISITATLDSTNSGLSANNTSASVTVQEILPQLTIVEESVRVSEGQSFTMTISTDRISDSNLPISIVETSSQNTNFTFDPTNLMLNAGDSTVSVVVTSPSNVSSDVVYRLSIASNSLYNTPSDELVLTVLDNDNPTASSPTVSITPITNSVVEGNPAQFRISLNPTNATASVSFKVSEVNNAFGTGVNTTQTHTITGTRTISVPTRAPNGITDHTSSISATLALGSGETGTDYRIADSPNHMATVVVTDESRPVLSIVADEHNSKRRIAFELHRNN